MEADKPRKLTENEIQDILSAIPNIKSGADTVSAQNTKSMKVLIREQLQDIEITPLGISDLKNEILRQYNQTLVRPGEMVGVLAADATSSKVTQSALNSFHTSGSAKNVSSGIQRITELINATKEPKNTSCSIFFKDNFLSFDDIIVKKRPEITEITVKDLVIGIPDVEKYREIEQPYWYSLYRTVIRDDFKSNYVLRLDIDPNLLYAYKLTMEDVCQVIEKDQPVICVYSSMSEGKIDIYPIESAITAKLRKIEIVSYENAPLIFLTMIVVPALDKLRISGVSGIRQIYPVESPVLQIVKEEMVDEKRKDIWYLILNPVRMKITGISVAKLIKLCEIAGMKILKERPHYIAVSSLISPRKVINDMIAKDSEDEKAYEKQKREEGARIIRRPPTEISIHSKLVYADTTGANLTELLSHPDIDSTRTYSNNVHEIREAFGIEAARSFLILEFISVLGAEGGYLNPRHAVLLVEYMTSLGTVYGVTFSGISRQPIGALEKSSFEKAMEVFKEAAGFGEEKTVSGTSASIFVGKRALVGTGYSENYIRPENLERYHQTRKELLDDPNMTLDINTFNDAIEQFNVDSGGDVMLMEGLEGTEEEMFGIGVEKEPEIPERPLVNPSTISEKHIIPGGEVFPPIKGKIVRSAELEQVVPLLNQSPCLARGQPVTTHVEALERPEIKSRSFEVEGQLPPNLLKEMEKIAASGKASLPSLPPISSAPSQISRPRPKPVAIFSLEDFLK